MSDAAVTVTVKNGKSHDDTWAVFKGTIHNVKGDLAEYYGLEVDDDQTLHEVALMAMACAQGSTTIARELGGKVIPMDERRAKQDDPPWQESEAEATEDYSDLIAELEAAASVDDLKRLWATNKDAFSDADVKAAYSKRGKALKK